MSFLGGLAGGAIGGAVVNLYLDDKQFKAGLASAEAQTGAAATNMGGAFGRLGPAAAAGFGLVAAAGVAAAAKLTYEFENTFTQIGALSNTSADQLQRWKDDVLSLAGEVGRAPQELAEALYFLSSAGLRTNDVMDALKASAQGAAVGLGTTADVANIIASAMNAYASEGLTAAHVTDTLVQAIKEGRAEPDEFATALGRILPIASKAGVSFDEVAASLAGLSNVGLDVNEGVTAMRGLLQALEAPGTQAADALAEAGVSTDSLRAAISEGGILQAMQLLEEATGGNIDQLRKIVPNVRALTAQFGLTGQSAEQVEAIFDNVKQSTGALDEAFRETAEGPGFKLHQLLAQLQVVGIRLGEALLPLAIALVDALSALAGSLASMSENLTELGIALGAAAAAWVYFNRVIVAVKLSEIATSLGTTAVAFAELVAPVYAVYKALSLANSELEHYREGDIPGVIGDITEAFKLMGLNVPEFNAETSDVEGYTQAIGALKASLEAGTISTEAAVIEQQRLADEFGVRLPQGAAAAVEQLYHVKDAAEATTKITGGLTTAMQEARKEAIETAQKYREDLFEAFRVSGASVLGFKRKFEGSVHSFLTGLSNMADRAKATVEDLKEFNKLDIGKGIRDFLLQQGPDAIHQFVEANKRGRDDAVGHIKVIVDAERELGGQIDTASDKVNGLTGAMGKLGQKKANPTVTFTYRTVDEDGALKQFMGLQGAAP